MSTLLKLEDITMQFGGVVAVNNLSLEVGEGEIVSLIGPNGAGKTTAFNVATGVYEPTNGRVSFAGKTIVESHPRGKMNKLYAGENKGVYTHRIVKTPEAAEEILGEAVRKFRKRFPEAELSVSVPEELLFVPMDPILIEQVLINLLENAVCHAVGMTTLALNVFTTANQVVFEVLDDGCNVNVEYTLNREVLPALSNVRICIPLPAGASPEILSVDGSYHFVGAAWGGEA